MSNPISPEVEVPDKIAPASTDDLEAELGCLAAVEKKTGPGDGVTLTEFHPFPRLPLELRLRIWALVPTKRIIEVCQQQELRLKKKKKKNRGKTKKTRKEKIKAKKQRRKNKKDQAKKKVKAIKGIRYQYYSPNAVPPILHVSSEARKECIRLYDLLEILGPTLSLTVYINRSEDIIFLNPAKMLVGKEGYLRDAMPIYKFVVAADAIGLSFKNLAFPQEVFRKVDCWYLENALQIISQNPMSVVALVANSAENPSANIRDFKSRKIQSIYDPRVNWMRAFPRYLIPHCHIFCSWEVHPSWDNAGLQSGYACSKLKLDIMTENDYRRRRMGADRSNPMIYFIEVVRG